MTSAADRFFLICIQLELVVSFGWCLQMLNMVLLVCDKCWYSFPNAHPIQTVKLERFDVRLCDVKDFA